jgi:hypothetical protein
MRLLIAAAACLTMAATSGAFAQGTPARLDDPKVNGRAVDRCADVNAENDCSSRGESQAALHACMENGYKEQAGAHWRAASGTALHFITEYDMHAGEVSGRWVEKPTSGVFDWVECRK